MGLDNLGLENLHHKRPGSKFTCSFIKGHLYFKRFARELYRECDLRTHFVCGQMTLQANNNLQNFTRILHGILQKFAFTRNFTGIHPHDSCKTTKFT